MRIQGKRGLGPRLHYAPACLLSLPPHPCSGELFLQTPLLLLSSQVYLIPTWSVNLGSGKRRVRPHAWPLSPRTTWRTSRSSSPPPQHTVCSLPLGVLMQERTSRRTSVTLGHGVSWSSGDGPLPHLAIATPRQVHSGVMQESCRHRAGEPVAGEVTATTGHKGPQRTADSLGLAFKNKILLM
jgi:hypothetical protein